MLLPCPGLEGRDGGVGGTSPLRGSLPKSLLASRRPGCFCIPGPHLLEGNFRPRSGQQHCWGSLAAPLCVPALIPAPRLTPLPGFVIGAPAASRSAAPCSGSSLQHQRNPFLCLIASR